ncbi:MAG: alpha amylase N-terminal ig-like domain-containing protein, partial [Bacilli bacterium]|nr:alpha amylase N-terminal ig-like domain-containing protein [Bacilli bacterium]
MHLSEFRHQSDSRYCFSLGPNQVMVRLAVAREHPLESATLVHGDQMT